MEKPLWYRWARVWVTGFSIIATGVLLFKYTVPTDEELIARFSPEIRADYERNKALRQKEQQELMKIAQQTAQSSDPIWMTGKITLPFEKDTRKKVTELVNRDNFLAAKQLEQRKSEVESAKAQLAETEQLVSQQKKSWFRW